MPSGAIIMVLMSALESKPEFAHARDAGAPVFSAVLRPNRSATLRGINILMIFIAAWFCATGIAFAYLGAWPITGFLGLDVALLYFALRYNLRALGRYESVEIGADALTLEQVNPWGRRSRVSFHPYWVQVGLSRGRLELRSHGRGVTFGAFLLPDEKSSLADAIRDALARVRATSTAI